MSSPGVAAVDDGIARLQQLGQLRDGLLGRSPAGSITHTARGAFSFAPARQGRVPLGASLNR